MKYIKTYADNAAYEADTTKRFPHVGYLKDTEEVIYVNEPEPRYRYLTLEAVDDCTFGFKQNVISYSLDEGETWTELGVNYYTPTVNAGERIMFKAEITGNQTYGIGGFKSTGRFNALGNPSSLVYGDDFATATALSNYAFYYLFSGTSIVSAAELALPATTIGKDCYCRMFGGCTYLTTPPAVINATSIGEGACRAMFLDCTSLTTAPELPATTLAQQCYMDMFRGCTSLATAPELPATTLAQSCYLRMFNGCTSLTTAPELPAINMIDSCYSEMFQGCTSLTTAPELPATSLSARCYRSMFSGCTSLNYIKMLATRTNQTDCLKEWVSGVSATGTFFKDASMTTLPTGDSGIPTGWTVIDA